MDKHGNMDWFAALEDNEIENQNLSTRQKVWTIHLLGQVHAGVAMIYSSPIRLQLWFRADAHVSLVVQSNRLLDCGTSVTCPWVNFDECFTVLC